MCMKKTNLFLRVFKEKFSYHTVNNKIQNFRIYISYRYVYAMLPQEKSRKHSLFVESNEIMGKNVCSLLGCVGIL